MSFPQDREEKRIGFCSAPWTDCITYANGELKACDRNIAGFGDWQKNGLKNTWHSKDFQNFRQAMAEGRYPNEDCASCHNNGTQRTAASSLGGAFTLHYDFLRQYFQREIPELANLYPLFTNKTRTAETDHFLTTFFHTLQRLQAENVEAFQGNKDFHDAIVKLRVTGECFQDYLAGELQPRRVAPFRQSQLQAKCTARCVMCVGKYTGEIVDGPTMDTDYVDEAFACLEDVTDFWCNGAEYLYYKDWKKIALMLAGEGGTKLRVSTNGILLTDPTIRFMIDNKILRYLTMSLDAATKQTMETTRINVNYTKNVERIHYLLHHATEKKHYFEFTAAFVLMKKNLHELPDFVRLIAAQRPANCVPLVTVLCQPLENFSIDGYRRFVHKEHHSLLGEKKLKEIFEATYKAHLETGVEVSFYNQKISEFMQQGMELPRYFAREMDEEIFFSRLPDGRLYLHDYLAEEFQKFAQEFSQYRETAQGDIPALKKLFFSELLKHPVIDEVVKISPKTEEELRQEIDRLIAKKLSHGFGEETKVYYDRYSRQALTRGMIVAVPRIQKAASIIEQFGYFVLLSNGRIVFQRKLYPVVMVENASGARIEIHSCLQEAGSWTKLYVRGWRQIFLAANRAKSQIIDTGRRFFLTLEPKA